jgi:hypothetical protein
MYKGALGTQADARTWQYTNAAHILGVAVEERDYLTVWHQHGHSRETVSAPVLEPFLVVRGRETNPRRVHG